MTETQTKAQHTPRPWFSRGCVVYGNDDGKGNGDVVADLAGTCGPNGRTPDEVEANACLIAAAPDLLAACEAMTKWLAKLRNAFPCLDWEGATKGFGGWPSVDAETSRHLRNARAAIAKAESK